MRVPFFPFPGAGPWPRIWYGWHLPYQPPMFCFHPVLYLIRLNFFTSGFSPSTPSMLFHFFFSFPLGGLYLMLLGRTSDFLPLGMARFFPVRKNGMFGLFGPGSVDGTSFVWLTFLSCECFVSCGNLLFLRSGLISSPV